MSVQTSPIGGSQPDLSKTSNISSEPFRKRKLPCDIECSCSDDLREMRSEISRIGSLLEKYVGSNRSNREKISYLLIYLNKLLLPPMKDHQKTKLT
ncbi:unnamed protein product [Euphydryas editha]|uniref:Uncharacterized protein n=1 Tax=Euphydryas editha TaxID=104508 RepID=A0AAU9U7K4_EUPED|nr:unnamed protein product [Euphydryas editha]